MLFNPLCFGHMVLALLYLPTEKHVHRGTMRSLCERVRSPPPRQKYLFLAFSATKPVLGCVLAEPRFTSCLLMIQGGHVGLSTLVETEVRRSRP